MQEAKSLPRKTATEERVLESCCTFSFAVNAVSQPMLTEECDSETPPISTNFISTPKGLDVQMPRVEPEVWTLSRPVSVLPTVEDSLERLKESGIISEDIVREVQRQQIIFEARRSELEEKYYSKTIVVCGGEVFVGDDLDEAIKKARKKFGDRPYYSESISVIDFPSMIL